MHILFTQLDRYSHRIQPWVHYVPVKNDFTDLYDIMTFFEGGSSLDAPNDETHTPGVNDAIAKKIALQGKEWTKKFWRKEDMIAYMFRYALSRIEKLSVADPCSFASLFLEYGRVSSEDRDSMSFDM